MSSLLHAILPKWEAVYGGSGSQGIKALESFYFQESMTWGQRLLIERHIAWRHRGQHFLIRRPRTVSSNHELFRDSNRLERRLLEPPLY